MLQSELGQYVFKYTCFDFQFPKIVLMFIIILIYFILIINPYFLINIFDIIIWDFGIIFYRWPYFIIFKVNHGAIIWIVNIFETNLEFIFISTAWLVSVLPMLFPNKFFNFVNLVECYNPIRLWDCLARKVNARFNFEILNVLV